jgi:hypothetical protein
MDDNIGLVLPDQQHHRRLHHRQRRRGDPSRMAASPVHGHGEAWEAPRPMVVRWPGVIRPGTAKTNCSPRRLAAHFRRKGGPKGEG